MTFATHRRPTATTPQVQTIGCVSYLNAKPLTDGLMDARVAFDVPSRLRAMLETNQANIALCPVVDYHRSSIPLEIVPVGGIGCLGPTLTVRLYSRVSFESMTKIHTDTDSHTSVILLQIVLWHRYGIRPQLLPYTAPRSSKSALCHEEHEAILLIGDKVITDRLQPQQFPNQLDLGEAWYDLTQLPFVFAVWMARLGAPLGDLPQTMDRLRRFNASRIDEIARNYGPTHGWPIDQAKQYLKQHIQYQIESPQLEAIERFSQFSYDLGLIDQLRTIQTRVSPKTCLATEDKEPAEK